VSNDIQREVDDALLDRGYKALVSALGPDGALSFLRASQDVERKAESYDGVKRAIVTVREDREGVMLDFSQPITWWRLELEDARVFVENLTTVISHIEEQK